MVSRELWAVGCSTLTISAFTDPVEEDFDEEDEVGEDNGRNKAPKKQLVSTIADSTRNAPCRPSPLINLRVTSNVAIRERTKLKIIANRFTSNQTQHLCTYPFVTGAMIKVPSPDPQTAMPVAKALLFSKYMETLTMAGK